MKRGISLSTLRRYIKAKKIPYRIENGRYLVLMEDGLSQAPEPVRAEIRPEKLETELKKAREEIAELKTLIALYEERMKFSQPRFDN